MITYSNPTANAMLDIITTKAEAGSGVAKIRIYSGVAPDNANTAIGAGNVLLAELPCGSPIAAASTDNTMTFNTVNSVVAIGSGIANFYRLVDSDNNVVIQGTISDNLGTGAIKLNNIVVYSGYSVTISSAAIVLPVHDDGSGGDDGFVDGGEENNNYTLILYFPDDLPTVPSGTTDAQSSGGNIYVSFTLGLVPYTNGATNPAIGQESIGFAVSTNNHPDWGTSEGIDSVKVVTFFDENGFYPNNDPQQDFSLYTYIYNSTTNIMTITCFYPPSVVLNGFPLEVKLYGSTDSWNMSDYAIDMGETIGNSAEFVVGKYLNFAATVNYTAGITPMTRGFQYFFPSGGRPFYYSKRIMWSVPYDPFFNYYYFYSDLFYNQSLEATPSPVIGEYNSFRLTAGGNDFYDNYGNGGTTIDSATWLDSVNFDNPQSLGGSFGFYKYDNSQVDYDYQGLQYMQFFNNDNWRYDLTVTVPKPFFWYEWVPMETEVFSDTWSNTNPTELQEWLYDPPERSPVSYGTYLLTQKVNNVVLTVGNIDVAEIAAPIRFTPEINLTKAPAAFPNNGTDVKSASTSGTNNNPSVNVSFRPIRNTVNNTMYIMQVTRIDQTVGGNSAFSVPPRWIQFGTEEVLDGFGGARDRKITRSLYYWFPPLYYDTYGNITTTVSSTGTAAATHNVTLHATIIPVDQVSDNNPFGTLSVSTGNGYPIQANITMGSITRGAILVVVAGDEPTTGTPTMENGYTVSNFGYAGGARKTFSDSTTPSDGLTTVISSSTTTLYDRIVTTIPIKQFDGFI